MHTSSRIGVVVATSILGAATILAGAGVANAQEYPDPTFSSASELGVERNTDGNIEVSYSNKSGKDLSCTVIVGEEDLLAELFDLAKSQDAFVTSEPSEMPADIKVKFDAAVEAGTLGAGGFLVEAEGEGPVEFVGFEFEPPMPTDPDFVPDGMSVCLAGVGGVDYVEVETTFGIGSLSNPFGSVDVFGSLGSLGF